MEIRGRYLGNVQVKADDGYTRNIAVIDKANLPKGIKGLTDKISFIAISKHLKDLKEKKNIRHPKLYVALHELRHVLYPEDSEYENRAGSDRIYNRITGQRISTVDYFKYAEKAGRF